MALSQKHGELHDKLKNQEWTYHEIAEEYGIDPQKFSDFMIQRFENKDGTREGKQYHLGYTLEWAERIDRGRHRQAADAQTSEVLDEAGL